MAGSTPARRTAQPRGGKAANRNVPAAPNGRDHADPAEIAAMEAETGVGQPPELAAAALEAARRQGEEAAMREVQAAAEGLTPLNSVEFMGARFRIADKVGLMPLMKFAAAADTGMDTSDMAGLAAVYSMLKDAIDGGSPACGQCEPCMTTRYAIRDARGLDSYEDVDLAADGGTPVPDCPHYDEGEWRRFEQHAIATKAGAEEMLPVVQQAITVLSARPTRRPAGSSSP